MRAKILLALPFLLLPLCVFAQDDKPVPIVAVFEIENRGSPLTDQQLLSLSDYLASKLGEGGNFRIVPRDEIRKRLLAEKAESHKACYDKSCQIEVGRELAAQMTVSSSINKIGSLCVISAGLFDLKKGATLRTATAKASCNPDEMVTAIEEIAAKLEGKQLAVPEIKKDTISPELPRFEPLPPLPPKKRKSVWAAFLWSCLPTGGMYYVGKWGWGIGYGVFMVGGMVGGGVMSSKMDDMWPGFGVMVGSMMIGYFGSMIHAVIAAGYWEPEDEQAGLRRDFSTIQAIGPGSDPFPAVTVPIYWGSF